MHWFKKVVFENYANFGGRARRKEFWMFLLTYFILIFILGIITGLLGVFGDQMMTVFMLALIVPYIAVTVRRLHDSGKSGWWYLAYFAPLVPAAISLMIDSGQTMSGGTRNLMGLLMSLSLIIWLIPTVFMFVPSEAGTNQWGPNPKEEGGFQAEPPPL